MTRRYARATQGRRAYDHARYQRGSNLTLIGALALRGLVGEMTLPGAVDSVAFATYITPVLVPNNEARGMCRHGQSACSQSGIYSTSY